MKRLPREIVAAAVALVAGRSAPCQESEIPKSFPTIAVGEAVTDEITSQGSVVHSPILDADYNETAVLGKPYRLALPERCTITIELRSYLFDAYLVVRDPSGEVIAEDDDGLLRSHARAVIETSEPKIITIEACSLSGYGAFNLRVMDGDQPTPIGDALAAAQLEDAREELRVRESRLGADDIRTAESLVDLGCQLVENGLRHEARTLFERSIQVMERARGPDDLGLVVALFELGDLHREEGRPEAARRELTRALSIAEAEYGSEDVATLTIQVCLARLENDEGDISAARVMYERILPMAERVFGLDDPGMATIANDLALLLDTHGEYSRAKDLFERALAIDEAHLGSDHSTTAAVLNNLASLLSRIGDYPRALQLYERSLAIREKVLGPNHPDTALSLNGLSGQLMLQGEFAEARALCQRALAIAEEQLGASHSQTAMHVQNLAVILEWEGRLSEARALYERAVRTCESELGIDHPDTVTSIGNLAHLLVMEGKYEEARELFERVVAIRERTLGPEHADTASSLAGLATVTDALGSRSEARALHERVLAIREATLGPDHRHTAGSLESLGKLHRAERNWAKAISCFERALAAQERTLGPHHPDIATCLSNLGNVLYESGDVEGARQLVTRALGIELDAYGEIHPSVLVELEKLALFDLNEGAVEDAVQVAERLVSVSLQLAHAQARRAGTAELARVASACEAGIAIRLTLARLANTSGGAQDEYEDVIAYKGLAAREAWIRRRSIAELEDAGLEAKLRELAGIQSALSNLHSIREVRNETEHERSIARLRGERILVEGALAAAVADRPELRSVSVREVMGSLPPGVALLDFIDVPIYEPTRWVDGAVVAEGEWGEGHLHVWVSRAEWDVPRWIDLGPSARIEDAILTFLSAFVPEYLPHDPASLGTSDVRGAADLASEEPRQVEQQRAAEAVRALLWAQLEEHVGDAWQLYVSPDGALGLLPMGILLDSEGRHLIERYSISIVEDASSLVRRGERTRDPIDTPSLLVMGSVDYQSADEIPIGVHADGDSRGSFTRAWGALPQTRLEASEIARLHESRFGSADRLLLTAQEPTEERLKSVMPGHSVLHLATHGYFLADGLRSLAEALEDPAERKRLESSEHQRVAAYYPSLLCGLVCAGANEPDAGRDNGLLTGEEVGALDLSGCDLVVLSACESGRGRFSASGQGAMSLSRAFRDAGARTVISSLWRVRDDSTRELMADFYDRLWTRGEGRCDALRNAQLEMLRRNRATVGDTRLDTWGAFVLTGERE